MGCDLSREKPDDFFSNVDDLEAYLNDPARAKKWENRLEFLSDPVCSGASCQMHKVRDKQARPGESDLYALKVMNGSSSHIHEMWMNEVSILRDLSSFAKERNLLEFVDAYRIDEKCYLLTRFYDGGDLFTAVENMGSKVYSERRAASMLRDMFRSVLVCHENNITHRDIKPENFVFDNSTKPSLFEFEPTPTLRLIDFGCSFQPTEVDLPAPPPLTLSKSGSGDRTRAATPQQTLALAAQKPSVQAGTPSVCPAVPPTLSLQASLDLSDADSLRTSASGSRTPSHRASSQRPSTRSATATSASSGKSSVSASGTAPSSSRSLEMQVPADRPHSMYYVAPEVVAPDIIADARYRWARCELCQELFYMKDLGKTLRSGERAEEKRGGRSRTRTKSSAEPLTPTSEALSPLASPAASPANSPTSAGAGAGGAPLLSTCCADGGSHVPDGHSRYRLRHKRLTATQRAAVVDVSTLGGLSLPAPSLHPSAGRSRSLQAETGSAPHMSPLSMTRPASEDNTVSPLSFPPASVEPLSLPTKPTVRPTAATPAAAEASTAALSQVYSFSPCMACGSTVCHERNVPFQAYCRVTQGLHMLLCQHDYHAKYSQSAFTAIMSASAMAAAQQHQHAQLQQAHTHASKRLQTVPYSRVPPAANRAALNPAHFHDFNAHSFAHYVQQAQAHAQREADRRVQLEQAGYSAIPAEPLVLQPLPITNPAGLFTSCVRPVAHEGQAETNAKPRSQRNAQFRSDPSVLRESGWRVCEECALLYHSDAPHTHVEEPAARAAPPTPSRSRSSRAAVEPLGDEPLPPCCEPAADVLERAFRSRAQFDPLARRAPEPSCPAKTSAEDRRLTRYTQDAPSDDEDDDSLTAYSMTQTLRPSGVPTRNEITLETLAHLVPSEIPPSALAGWTLAADPALNRPARVCALPFFEEVVVPSLGHRPLPLCVAVDVGRVLSARTWRDADVWALGIVMYVLLTGRAPFFDHDPQQLQALVAQCYWAMPDVSPQAQHLLSKILVRDPHLRPSPWQILHHPWLAPGAAPTAPLRHVAAALMSLRKDAQAGHANLRRVIARAMMAGMMTGGADEQTTAYLEAVLAHVDHDGDRELSTDDVAVIVARFNGDADGEVLPALLHRHVAHAQDIMDQMQLTPAGKLPLSELRVALVAATIGSPQSLLGSLEDIFDRLDYDKDGSLSAQDLYHACRPYLTMAEATDLVVVLADVNSHGRISLEAFTRAMTSSLRYGTSRSRETTPEKPDQTDAHGDRKQPLYGASPNCGPEQITMIMEASPPSTETSSPLETPFASLSLSSD